jgi:hypothetical protein
MIVRSHTAACIRHPNSQNAFYRCCTESRVMLEVSAPMLLMVSEVADRCIVVSGEEPPVLSLVVDLLGLFGAQAVVAIAAISSSAATVFIAFILCVLY